MMYTKYCRSTRHRADLKCMKQRHGKIVGDADEVKTQGQESHDSTMSNSDFGSEEAIVRAQDVKLGRGCTQGRL